MGREAGVPDPHPAEAEGLRPGGATFGGEPGAGPVVRGERAVGSLPNPEGSALRRMQNSMKKLMKFTFPAVYGRGLFNYDFGWMPHRRRIVSVVGAPIHISAPFEGDLY